MKMSELKFTPVYGNGKQALVDFGKYEMSIVSHEHSYGGKNGLYEIAIFEGNNQVELPGITEEGDTVKGFLRTDDVDVLFKKMFVITGSEGTQIGV